MHFIASQQIAEIFQVAMSVGALAVMSGPNLAHLRYCEVNKLEDKTV